MFPEINAIKVGAFEIGCNSVRWDVFLARFFLLIDDGWQLFPACQSNESWSAYPSFSPSNLGPSIWNICWRCLKPTFPRSDHGSFWPQRKNYQSHSASIELISEATAFWSPRKLGPFSFGYVPICDQAWDSAPTRFLGVLWIPFPMVIIPI